MTESETEEEKIERERMTRLHADWFHKFVSRLVSFEDIIRTVSEESFAAGWKHAMRYVKENEYMKIRDQL